MGLFSSLRTERQPVLPEQTEKLELPSLSRGMVIHVTLPSGDDLLTGKLISLSSTSLTLERLPHALSFKVCNKGERVFIRGCNQQLVPFIIQGTVEESTRTVFKLKDLKSVPLNEHRDNFRLTLNSPATLHYLTDNRFQNPESCILMDISVGGARIQSEFLHAEGEALHLRVKLEDYAAMEFLGEIIRVQEISTGLFQYGFLFAQLTEDEITSLAKTIYNIQVGNRSAWLSYPDEGEL